jgi:hypothetical protein
MPTGSIKKRISKVKIQPQNNEEQKPKKEINMKPIKPFQALGAPLIAGLIVTLSGCGGGGTTTNHAPEATDQNITTNEDTTKTITLTGTDEDNDTLTFTITTNPEHGTLTAAAALAFGSGSAAYT